MTHLPRLHYLVFMDAAFAIAILFGLVAAMVSGWFAGLLVFLLVCFTGLALLLVVLAGVRLTSGMVLALLTGLVGVAILLKPSFQSWRAPCWMSWQNVESGRTKSVGSVAVPRLSCSA